MKAHPLYDVAHAMVEYEIYTFLWDNVNGAKTPLTKHGHQDATIDHDVLDRMMAAAPRTAKLGYDNGRSEILVSDIDVAKNGNPDGLTALEEAGFIIPADAFFLETPSGGLHFPMQTLSKLPARALNYLVPNHDRLGARGWTGFYGTLDDLDLMMGNLLEAPDWMLQDTGIDYAEGSQYATKEEFDDWAELHDDGEPSRFGVLFRMVQKLPAELNGNEALYSKWVLPMVGAATRGAQGGTTALMAVKQAWNHPHHGKNGNEWADSKEFPRAVRRAIKATENDVNATDVTIKLLQPPAPAADLDDYTGADPDELFEELDPTEGGLFADWSEDAPEPPKPTMGEVRGSEYKLFYSGKVNTIYAQSETGKSLAALAVVIEQARLGKKTVWLDTDHNGRTEFETRARAFGADLSILHKIKFASLNEKDDVLKVMAYARDNSDLFVLDAMDEYLSLMGASANRNDEMLQYLQVLHDVAGDSVTVIVIDHEAKNKESQEHGAGGGTAKKNTIDGAMYQMRADHAFRPGSGGKAVLSVMKDRSGGVRRHLGDDRKAVAAEFIVSASGEAYFERPSSVAAEVGVVTSIKANLPSKDDEATIRNYLETHDTTGQSPTGILTRIAAASPGFPGATARTRELLNRVRGNDNDRDVLDGTS